MSSTLRMAITFEHYSFVRHLQVWTAQCRMIQLSNPFEGVHLIIYRIGLSSTWGLTEGIRKLLNAISFRVFRDCSFHSFVL